MTHTSDFFHALSEVSRLLEQDEVIEDIVTRLALMRVIGGRLFIMGIGGSAANASHAVNDFRKLCGIDTHTPTDNVAELTARINDEGWDSVFSNWLSAFHFNSRDILMVFSVGGGDRDRKVSVNLIEAIDYALDQNGLVVGVTGRVEGYLAQTNRLVICIPVIAANAAEWITPITETMQAAVWHCLVSHPRLQIAATKW